MGGWATSDLGMENLGTGIPGGYGVAWITGRYGVNIYANRVWGDMCWMVWIPGGNGIDIYKGWISGMVRVITRRVWGGYQGYQEEE